MYSTGNDLYTCDYCGIEMKWDGTDDTHGEMWGCERCGDAFCSKCFIDKFGVGKWMKMMRSGSSILCPTCYRKDEAK